MAKFETLVIYFAFFLSPFLHSKHLTKAHIQHHNPHTKHHAREHNKIHADALKRSQTFSVVIDPTKPHLNSFIRVINPPGTFHNRHRVQVEYSCQEGDLVAIQIFLRSDDIAENPHRVFHYDWTCNKYSHGTRRTFVQLAVPDWLAHRPDYLQPYAFNVVSLELKAWIVTLRDTHLCRRWSHLNCYERAYVKGVYSMEMVPVYQRPRRDYDADCCLSWRSWMMLNYLNEDEILRCRLEEEIVQLVDFPVAFSEAHSGITKDLPPFQYIALLNQQHRNKYSPRFTISTMIFLLEYCSIDLCGIIHRKRHTTNDYITPLLFLTKKGLIHIQVVLNNGQASGMVSNYQIPLREWVRLVYKQDGNRWTLSVSNRQNFTNVVLSSSMFPKPVKYDEAEGLIHLGGSNVCKAFSGFIADTWLWRTRVIIKQDPQLNSSTPVLLEKIGSYFTRCDDLKERMLPVYQMYQKRRLSLLAERSCANSPSSILDLQSPSSSSSSSSDSYLQICQLWERRPPRGYGHLWRALRIAALQNRPYKKSYAFVGERLHRKAVQYLSENGLSSIPAAITTLRQASCYGNPESSYMLGTLYAGGVNVDADQNEAYLHWLVAAQGDNRLAMMALANHHFQGLNTASTDFDFSYNYFKKLADLTVKDRERHDPDGVLTEYVRLTDTAALQVHKGEDSDHFLWLKYQAKKGIAQAQLDMARMLFWGQRGVDRDVQQAVGLYQLYLMENPLDEVVQYDFGVIRLRSTVARLKFWGSEGVKRDMKTAVKYYEKSAKEMPRNKVALYDYGIVLLRGQGIEKNVEKALEHLNKSAELGHAPAYTALGWYAINFQNDMKKAARYFDIADRLGHKDAMHNLGYMYKSGRYPGKPADEAKALWYFQKAADRGHIDSAGVVAEIYNEGTKDMERSSYKAAFWSRLVCEKNPEIGMVLRKGVDAYLAGSWGESIVYYMMVAETGLEVAQFNLAHLCEEDHDGEASRYLRSDCVWKYYNLSSRAVTPHVVCKWLIYVTRFGKRYSDVVFSMMTAFQREIFHRKIGININFINAQLKMGDFHYYGYLGDQDLTSAVQYYTMAAKRREPQALFNLAFLVEEGAEIDDAIWKSLRISPTIYDAQDKSELVMTLYRRCRDGGNRDSYLPCGLALLRVQLMNLWGKHTLAVQVSSALMLGVLMLCCISTCLRRTGSHGDTSSQAPPPAPSLQE